MNLEDKDYIVVLQCHITKERCSGYFCEKSFQERSGGFQAYPKDKDYRLIFMTCGGCCGKAALRKLSHLTKLAKRSEDMEKDRIVVQLSSCMTKDNFHSSRCQNIDMIKTLVARAGLDCREDTRISKLAEKRRAQGLCG